MLIILLIILLIVIILYNLCNNHILLENMTDDSTALNKSQSKDLDQEEYQHYYNLEKDQKTGPLFLALKNAANISSLHSKIDQMKGLKEKVESIQNHVKINTKGISQLSNKLTKYGNSLVGGFASKGKIPEQVTRSN